MLKFISSGYSKATLLIVSGIIIAFFPGIISGAASIIGGIVLVVSIVSLVMKFMSGGAFSIGGNIVGILAGIAIMLLPSLIHNGIPIAVGLFLIITGTERIVRAVKNSGGRNYKIINGIFGGITLVLGIFVMCHTHGISSFLRIIIGIALIVMGALNVWSEKNPSASDDGIIDVDSYSVSDDKKFLK